MTKRIFYLCLLPLCIGGVIYIFFRKNGLVGLLLHVTDFKPGSVWKVLINTLPDFYWAFSLSNALYIFFNSHNFSFKRALWVIGFVIIFSEIVQLLVPTYFTFDVLDLFAVLLAFILSSMIAKSSYENKSV